MLLRKPISLPPFSPQKALTLACVLTAPVLLTACASTPVGTVKPFETALRDVCISQDDSLTEKTAQQIEANNLALRELLERGSQCPKPTGRTKQQPAVIEPKTS